MSDPFERYYQIINPNGFWCDTCNSLGCLLTEYGVFLGECICPTCHGESLGISFDEYAEQCRRDAENDY